MPPEGPAGWQSLLSVLGVNEDEDEGEGANKSYPLIAWARVSSAIGVCHNFSFANIKSEIHVLDGSAFAHPSRTISLCSWAVARFSLIPCSLSGECPPLAHELFHVKHRASAAALSAWSKRSKFAGQLEHSSSALEERDGFRGHPRCRQASASFRSAYFCLQQSACSAAPFRWFWGSTTPRLDNVHRFMAGIYFGSALIALWPAQPFAGRAR